MKVGFFLLKFPLSSETFVLNQITALLIWALRWRLSHCKKAIRQKHPRGMDEI
ncbi:putative colanic acid biosynthesis glycosyltransferase [Escherichia coli]|uniref:Putative colanic acid biosynthesis glycosyltransferase n=1 Tax=Escherichia coli TaxID=562 RepID=A0A376RI57_ECOLX|nr:putative colanic acid biosynthesis glycosyltransferase [Escherichia coli]